MENGVIQKNNNIGKEKEQRKRGGPAIASFVETRMKTGSTNLPEGIVHIYRDPPRQTDDCIPSKPSQDTKPLSPSQDSQSQAGPSKSDILSDSILRGVLAVPSWMTPADFLAFVAPAAEGMVHLRLIRDSVPNRSIAVIQFRNEADAAEFTEAYNGKLFNSMESEACHVVRILSVEIDSEDLVNETIARSTTAYELPTCPVCLERMDSAVTGLVTVPCSHTFHCTCLSKWGDSRCPVCRYSQTLMSSHPTSASSSRSTVPIPFSSSSQSQCVDCPHDSPSTSNLWICLICGNIGCGRYGRAHAQAHYQRTTHLYALELETQRVWDYAGDGYVHRLIQNKADGKLVELPSAASSMVMSGSTRDTGAGPSPADALSAEKIEAIGIEYSYLLTSQLDSQRTFYEEQTTELRTQVDELRRMLEGLSNDVEKDRERAREEQARLMKQEQERTAEVERARVRAEKRAEKASELARALEKDLKAERAMTEGMHKNLTAAKEREEQWKEEKKSLNEEKEALMKKVLDLEDQVKDVMFFLEAKEKIESGEGVISEAAGGSIGISQPSPSPPPINGNARKKKGKKK